MLESLDNSASEFTQRVHLKPYGKLQKVGTWFKDDESWDSL